MSTFALKFFSACVEAKDVRAFLRHGSLEPLFKFAAPSDVEAFQFIDQFVKNYGALPQKETFEQQTGQILPTNTETPDFLHDQLVAQHIHRSIVKNSDEASKSLQSKDPKKALSLFTNMVTELQAAQMGNTVFDFRNAAETLIPAMKHKKALSHGVEIGWPTFDKANGGLQGGDLLSIVGRPGMGKSFLGLYIALSVWSQEKPVMFVSMEMNELVVMERLAAMHFHKPLSMISKGGFSNILGDAQGKFEEALKALKEAPVPFHIIHANMAGTVYDIESLCRQMKPALCVIDGAYLLKHPNNRLNKFERVAENCDLIKQRLCTSLNMPTVAIYQMSRDATKLKKGEKPGIEHIADSDAIGKNSSIVMGLLQPDSIETALKRQVDIMKGRGGETGLMTLNWDFDHMDFSEFEEQAEKLLFM